MGPRHAGPPRADRAAPHPPAPPGDRLAVATAQQRPAGPADLAYLRKGETFAELAAGSGISIATAWRYVTETVALLAARSPKLRRALRDAKKAGHAYLVIDGTLIPIDRVAADRPFYSGKHRRHGMNLQVIASPEGEIVWVSGPLPGAVHDLTAARIWGIVRELAASGLIVLADKGYTGAGDPLITHTRAAASPSRRRTPTAPTPGYAAQANARTPSSRTGASYASSAAAPGAPGSSPKPSMSFKPARSKVPPGWACGPRPHRRGWCIVLP
jgi:DDE superfamily endonuclease/Helix-turn-helix of DDE superfamily endonuclease